MISVSAIPGGNPVAKNDPENWALDYGKCATCNAHWCDRCLKTLPSPNCPKDQTQFTMYGVTPERPAAPAPTSTPAASATKPWWKFWG